MNLNWTNWTISKFLLDVKNHHYESENQTIEYDVIHYKHICKRFISIMYTYLKILDINEETQPNRKINKKLK